MPNSQRDVLARLRDCVAGKLSIERFYKQVSDDVWTASESSDPGFRELMSSIALLVAEYSANHRTAEDVLSQFSKLLPALTFSYVSSKSSFVSLVSGDYSATHRPARIEWSTEFDSQVCYLATRHVEIMTPDWENALALAHMVLAEHPADEEEPVTADWLESIGFCRVDRGMRIDTPFAGQHHLRHTNVFRHDDGQWWANGLGCSECKTRSDVRRLCKALGVEVKE